jgi:hypothetical protein
MLEPLVGHTWRANVFSDDDCRRLEERVDELAAGGRLGLPSLMLAVRDGGSTIERLCALRAIGHIGGPAASEAVRRIRGLPPSTVLAPVFAAIDARCLGRAWDREDWVAAITGQWDLHRRARNARTRGPRATGLTMFERGLVGGAYVEAWDDDMTDPEWLVEQEDRDHELHTLRYLYTDQEQVDDEARLSENPRYWDWLR